MSDERSPREVVVGVDGSDSSSSALRWAAHDATLRGVPLVVVHVAPAGDPGLSAGDVSELVAENAGAQTRAEIVCRTGKPASELVEFSTRAGVVVVGRFGNTETSHRMIGSVGAALLRHAHCPVVVVHDDAAPEHRRRPVLVGIDGSHTSVEAARIAFDEASRRGVDLLALHVCKEIDTHDPGSHRTVDMQLDAEALLTESLAALQENYPGVAVHRLVRFANPAKQLLVQSERAQLVVLGSHGRGAVAGVLLGSVSGKVADECRRPVLVARRR